jgi:MATE family multidrug resistance protein
LQGVGYSTLITQILIFIMILLYSASVQQIRPAVFNPFTRQALVEASNSQKVKVYLKLAVPSVLMFCLEWNAFQFLILMAGYISNNHLAAQVILYNICFVSFIVAYGISMAASTLVGNSIGA